MLDKAFYGRKAIDRFGEFVKTYKAKGLAWIAYKEDGVKSPISKFLATTKLWKY